MASSSIIAPTHVVSGVDLRQELAVKLRETTEAIESLCSGWEFDPSTSATRAVEFLRIAERLKEGIFNGSSPAERRGKEIPYPLTYRLFQLVTRQEIQFYEQIKQPLIIAFRIFLELTVFHCHDQKKRIYESSSDELRKRIKEVRSTLPAGEVRSYFELSCVAAVLRKFSSGLGGAKQLASKHASPLGIALLQIALSASPLPPFVSPSPLVAPLVDLAKDIFNSLEKSWYQPIWVCRSLAMESRIKQVGDFEAIQGHLKEWKDNYKLAFYISLLFQSIIHNPNTPDDLRTLLITGRVTPIGRPELTCEPNLIALASYKGYKWIKNKIVGEALGINPEIFWRVRYQSLEGISQIIPKLPQGDLRNCLKQCLTSPLDQTSEIKEHPAIIDQVPDWVASIAYANRETLLSIKEDVHRKKIAWSQVKSSIEEALPLYHREEMRLQGLIMTAELSGEFGHPESANLGISQSGSGGKTSNAEQISLLKAQVAEQMSKLEGLKQGLVKIEGDRVRAEKLLQRKDLVQAKRDKILATLPRVYAKQEELKQDFAAVVQAKNAILAEIALEEQLMETIDQGGGRQQSGSSSSSMPLPTLSPDGLPKLRLQYQLNQQEIEKLKVDQKIISAISRIEKIFEGMEEASAEISS